MTVDQWYQARQGQSLLVPGADPADRGQCVQAADYALNEVYGLNYVWLNASEWWTKYDITPQLRNNFNKVTDGSIKKGDIVIFNSLVGSSFGHIDMALSDGSIDYFVGADSNWGGVKDTNPESPTYGYPIVHQVQHYGRQYVLGSLRLKGGPMDYMMQPQDVRNIYPLYFPGGTAPEAIVNKYAGLAAKDFAYKFPQDPSYLAEIKDWQNWKATGIKLTQDPAAKQIEQIKEILK